MSEQFVGSTTLYHPTGARCVLPLSANPMEAFNLVNAYIEAGFLVNAPVEVEGAKTLDVDYVIRCEYEYEGKKKERLYFYDLSSKYSNSAMTVYPDDDDKVKAFERAAGFTIASMPLFTGKVAPTSDSGEYFEKYARPVKFTVSRVFEEKSQKYPTGRWKLLDYVSGSKVSAMPQNAPKTGVDATGDGEGDKTTQTAKDKALAWAEKKGYDKTRYPYPTGDPHSEAIAKNWCINIEQQQGKKAG